MNAAMLGFKFLLHFAEKNPSEQNLNLTSLSSDEKACYEKIALELLRHCKERVVHPTIHPDKNASSLAPRVYHITFRQSESWREVETLLNKLILKTGSDKTKKWVSEWQNRISQMRTLEHSIQDFIKEIKICQDALKNSNLSPKNIDDCKQQIQKLTSQIENNQQAIVKLLNEGATDINILWQNASIKTGGHPCSEVINFLSEKWPFLTIFADWSEVSMDEKKLSVRVITPSNDNKKDDQLQDDDIQLSIIPFSTKAIIVVQETEIEERSIQYVGTAPGKILRPIGIELKDKSFASSPGARKRSSSIKMEMSDELVFNYDFGSDETESKKREASGLQKYPITSLAEKIDGIATLALKKVNSVLANHSDLTDETIEAFVKSEQNENGHTQESSWNRLTITLKPFLGFK